MSPNRFFIKGVVGGCLAVNPCRFRKALYRKELQISGSGECDSFFKDLRQMRFKLCKTAAQVACYQGVTKGRVAETTARSMGVETRLSTWGCPSYRPHGLQRPQPALWALKPGSVRQSLLFTWRIVAETTARSMGVETRVASRLWGHMGIRRCRDHSPLYGR